MGSGNGKIAAALIAGGIGAYVGNRIGNMLDEKDQQALALRTQEVLSQQQATASAQPVTWKSDHSGASAQIVPGKEYTKTKQVEVKRAPKIQAVPSMKLINEPYVTTSDNLNVRAAPNASGEKVGSLKNHTEFTAVGATGDWILVGRKGVTVGYVHKDYVEPKAQAVAKRVTPAVNLDELDVAASKEPKPSTWTRCSRCHPDRCRRSGLPPGHRQPEGAKRQDRTRAEHLLQTSQRHLGTDLRTP